MNTGITVTTYIGSQHIYRNNTLKNNGILTIQDSNRVVIDAHNFVDKTEDTYRAATHNLNGFSRQIRNQ